MFDAFYEADIAAAAGRIERSAAAIRARERRLRLAVIGCGWDGAGARAFRARAASATARLVGAADGLDAAALALRRHGTLVAHELAARAAK